MPENCLKSRNNRGEGRASVHDCLQAGFWSEAVDIHPRNRLASGKPECNPLPMFYASYCIVLKSPLVLTR